MKDTELLTPTAAERLLRQWLPNLPTSIPTGYQTIRAAIDDGELRAVRIIATDRRVMLAVSVGELRSWANARVAIALRHQELRRRAGADSIEGERLHATLPA